jgi:hypothetical protein
MDTSQNNPTRERNWRGAWEQYTSEFARCIQVNVPRIDDARVEGKNLIVLGVNFSGGAQILLDGDELITKMDNQNRASVLIGKKVTERLRAASW